MGSTPTRLWDAERRDSYARERDEALARRADEREGVSTARDIDAVLAALSADERGALEYLLLAAAPACIGRCNEPLLTGLMARGLLIWPPGIRPVLTDDLVTSFVVPPAVWTALNARLDILLPQPDRALALERAEQRFRDRMTPVAVAPDQSPESAPSRQGT